MAQDLPHLLSPEVMAAPVAEDSEMQQVEQIQLVKVMREAIQLACMGAQALKSAAVVAVAQVL